MVSTVLGALAQLASILGAHAAIDLADPAYRDLWLSHPVIGDVSYDSFVRAANNPIYTGKPPYEWAVNGSLFRDPANGDWYCYVGLYPKGYWPAGPAAALRSRDQGRTWEDLGVVLQGDPKSFDGDGTKAGAVPDVHVIADAGGYHMCYDWAKPDNSDGGLGYAFAKSPAGPWIRDPKPIHAQSAQPMIPPMYQRVYAGSIVRRKNDWLVIASMSGPGNSGGMWADICMTAPNPHGPWSPPIFLRKPQDGRYSPQPVEFFPAFTHDGFVYAPHTSVAANRGYQIIYRAAIEDAHKPEAWSVFQAGSLFHAECIASEAMGIWGQTFGGFVDPEGVFRIMYPSRRADSVGTINIASRPWNEPMQHGFWLSGPNAASLGLVQRSFRDFSLEVELKASGPWRLIWGHRGPLGPDRSTADATLSSLSLKECTWLAVDAHRTQIKRSYGVGEETIDWRGLPTGESVRVSIRRKDGAARVSVGDQIIGAVGTPSDVGALGLVAEKGTCLRATRFELDTKGEPLSTFWLPLEGLLNAGDVGTKWKPATDHFRFGTGYTADFEGARAKWTFFGPSVRLWSPRGPAFGKADVFIDGIKAATIDLHAGESAATSVVWESESLASGPHAIMIVRADGLLPVDCIEVTGD